MYTKKNLPKSFDFINNQWQLCLERLALNEKDLPEQQRESMKRAFVAGAGQMLVAMRDDLSVYPEVQGIEIMTGMFDQMHDWWKNELLKHGGKLN